MLMTEDFNTTQERCLSIFWNMTRILVAYSDRNGSDDTVQKDEDESFKVKAKLCLERLLFKFLENNQSKIKKLCELLITYYERIQEFDLNEFKELSEIMQLETHFSLDIQVLIA